MPKLDELRRSGDLIGPIIVEPGREFPSLPCEFTMVGNLFQEHLDHSGDTTANRQKIRREFHRLLNIAIDSIGYRR